ncbi:hypothetical protein DL771_004172 [Monosporascus sp. 5C6A]|nr:hypothetical protein DL771_004172 [Monosporascus sp. 5C6A]
MAAIWEPLVRRHPNNPRIASVWGLFCGAVRELGSDREASIDSDERVEISEWAAQGAPSLNATSFAATWLASSPGMAPRGVLC